MQNDDFELTTPVAFIIFNRPDTAKKVFAKIREAKPSQLLVIADGPRKNKVGEAEKCQQCRDIIKSVDWDCEVKTNYADVNLGCKKRVSSGITWVFENVEEAIILEDDCLPHSTFFQYCQELLSKYKEDERIMMVSGDNVWKSTPTKDSYYFSRLMYIWGWATWKRAWDKYDVKMNLWPEIRDSGKLEELFPVQAVRKEWLKNWQLVYDGGIDTWDFQWSFCTLINNGLCVMPKGNLISNIGFGENATHTIDENNELSNRLVDEMVFPMKHPQIFLPEKGIEYATCRFWEKIKNFVRKTKMRF
jgi:hypothetical protein